MKTQKFYPRQVLRSLIGDHDTLNAGQRAALAYAMRKGRKLGVTITVAPAPATSFKTCIPTRVGIYGDGQRSDGFPRITAVSLAD